MPKALLAEAEKMLLVGENAKKVGADEGGVFRAMALASKDFEEIAAHSERLIAYQPTFERMTVAQLATFFAWRTRLYWVQRAGGRIPRAPFTSYAMVYIYCVLNGVYSDDPVETHKLLKDFWTQYRETDFTLDRNVPKWLDDLVLFWHLDEKLLRITATELPRVRAPMAHIADSDLFTEELPGLIAQAQSAPTSVIGRRMCIFLKAEIAASRFLKDAPDKFEKLEKLYELLGLSWRAWVLKKGPDKVESEYLEFRETKRRLFEEVPFDFSVRSEPIEWVDSKSRSWRVENGEATCSCIQVNSKAASNLIKEFFFAAETALRVREARGKFPRFSKKAEIQKAVQAACKQLDQVKRRQDNPARKINFSGLDRIREDALVNQERLVSEAERTEEHGLSTTVGEGQKPQSISSSLSEKTSGSAALSSIESEDRKDVTLVSLSPEDAAFVRGLLVGSPTTPPDAPELLVDRINEALYDEIGDAVLEMTPSGPQIIEDYKEDLERLFGMK